MFKSLKNILNVCGTHKKRIYGGIVCGLLNAGFNSLSVMAFLWVLMHINSLNMTVIWQTTGILAVALVGKIILKYLINMFLAAAGYIVYTDKRLELGEKLKQAPMGYFSKKSLGQINNTISSAMTDLENGTMIAVENVIGGLLQSVAVSVFLIFFDWRIGCIAILGILLSMFSLTLVQKKSVQFAPERYRIVEKTTSDILEFIRGIAVVRSFGRKNGNELDKSFEEFQKVNTAMEISIIKPHSLFRGTLYIFSGILILVSSFMTFYGMLDFAYGMMFLLSAFIIYGQIELLGNGTFLLEQVETALSQLEETFKMPEMIGKAGVKPENFSIEMKDVEFGYDSRTILSNVTASIPEKTSCAIIGSSGSGKTTLCNLIVRFWDVKKGSITFGGHDIREYTPDELLSYFSMVFQKVYLFNDTIENNIRFGKPDATHEEIVAVAKKAKCHDFIMALPNGYDTVISESGSSLSGGEKQRISIARALLKNAPVVILDEATSSVDPENEADLLDAIKELTAGKTVISIAHRMNTIRDADQILVIDHGTIAEHGKHDELNNKNGIYSRFLKIRSNAFGWNLLN
ncbi:MAG: ABC transporter ATP-binding protein [Fibrobacter sp.]|nr:ABC transporter ATP-binding protein [Fibrobacter sp.]